MTKEDILSKKLKKSDEDKALLEEVMNCDYSSIIIH